MQFDEILYSYNAKLSTADSLYSDLFRIGEHFIQRKGEYRSGQNPEYKGNPMIYVNDGEDYTGKMKRYILLEDTLLQQLHVAQQCPSNLVNAVSYFGRKKDKEHADRCFGLIFDIDGIDEGTLLNFVHGCHNDIYPCPNYLVISKSGKGMHLYYIFDEPIRLFPKIKIQLKELKYNLIRKMWNPYTSRDKKVQFQSYDQSFMVAGTFENMRVYKLRNELWDVVSLSRWGGLVFKPEELWQESSCSLEEAKIKYPEWYQSVIVEGKVADGQWYCKRDLYEWWKRKIMDYDNGATYGHRYWCIMMLVVYAVKCGVSFNEVAKDAYGLMPYMNNLNLEKPFTKADVSSALDCYDKQFATFPINDISRLSGITIERNKRNGRKQAVHLARARAVQDIDYPNGEWRKGNGRKSKEDIVREWRQLHPEGKKIDCSRETGLHINTVYKWWNQTNTAEL